MSLYSYSQPSQDESLFGHGDIDDREVDDLIRRDQEELDLERRGLISQISYPPQPEVEFGFPKVCYCGAKPTLVTRDGRRLYICDNRDDDQCHVYKWWDEALMEEMRARDVHLIQVADKVESLALLSDFDTESKIRNLERKVNEMAKEKKSEFGVGFEWIILSIVVVLVVVGLVVMLN